MTQKTAGQEGMTLLIALSVLMIFLILSLAIITMITGNIKIVGNINDRAQALMTIPGHRAKSDSKYGAYLSALRSHTIFKPDKVYKGMLHNLLPLLLKRKEEKVS